MKFYCEDCGSRVDVPGFKCDECGSENTFAWQCRCGHINSDHDSVCPECGTTREYMRRALQLEVALPGNLVDEITSFVTGVCVKKGMPIDYIDDAVGDAILNIVSHINDYDKERGEFMQWAKGIAYTSLMDMGRRGKKSADVLSLDYEGEDGEVFAETVAGDDGRMIDILADIDAVNEFVSRGRSVMIDTLSGVPAIRRQGTEVVYTRMVKAYGDGQRGWKTRVAEAAGLHRATMWKTLSIAREKWEASYV